MRKTAVILFIAFTTSMIAQQVKFALLYNPSVSDIKSSAVIDSAANFINRNNEINFTVIAGNLTKNGSVKETEVFNNTVSKILKPVFILHGLNDVRDANNLKILEDISNEKFSYKLNNNSLIGVSPVIPLTKLNHFGVENLEWFSSVLDTIKIGESFIFISPVDLEKNVDNWETLFSLFDKKIPQLIINSGEEKTSLRNFKGYSMLDVASTALTKAKLPNFTIVGLSKDSINIFDSAGNLIAAIDKTILLEKDSIGVPSVEAINADILMQTELNSTMITSASYWKGHIYTSDESGLITCLDSTGNVLWDYDAGGTIYGKPVLADGMFSFATFQGDVTSISTITGEQIQSIGFEETITTDLHLINYEGKKELMIPKLNESNSAVVFGTADGKVFCYDLETLQQYWVNNDAGGTIYGKPIYAQNKILFTSRDGYIYCIDARDGLLIWRWKEKADTDLSGSPIYSNDKSVFVVSQDGIVYSINLLLGRLEWKVDKFNGSSNFGISNDNSTLYIFGKNNSFYIIDAVKGRIVKEIKSAGTFYESLDHPVNYNGNIFFGAEGTIFKLNDKFLPEKIIFTGKAPMHPLINISQNKFLSSNIDGRIIIFSLR